MFLLAELDVSGENEADVYVLVVEVICGLARKRRTIYVEGVLH